MHLKVVLQLLSVQNFICFVVVVPNSVCFWPLGISGGVEVVGHMLECRSMAAERSIRERHLSGPAGEDGRATPRSSKKIKLKGFRLKQIKEKQDFLINPTFVRLQLQGMSCLCLSKMVADTEIMYMLLERACEDRDVDMAECLIKLGADINKKTKSDSLIYQV